MLVGHGQPFDDIGKHASAVDRALGLALLTLAAVDLDQAGDDFQGNVLGRGVQHLLQLMGAEPLYDHVLLFLSELILFVKLLELSLVCLPISAESVLGILQVLGLLLVVALQEPSPAFLHLEDFLNIDFWLSSRQCALIHQANIECVLMQISQAPIHTKIRQP